MTRRIGSRKRKRRKRVPLDLNGKRERRDGSQWRKEEEGEEEVVVDGAEVSVELSHE